jgi:hypothetical protein
LLIIRILCQKRPLLQRTAAQQKRKHKHLQLSKSIQQHSMFRKRLHTSSIMKIIWSLRAAACSSDTFKPSQILQDTENRYACQVAHYLWYLVCHQLRHHTDPRLMQHLGLTKTYCSTKLP